MSDSRERVMWRCPFCKARKMLAPKHVDRRRTCGTRLCRQRFNAQQKGLQLTQAGLEYQQQSRGKVGTDKSLNITVTPEGWAF